jgi:hypothetical protein
MLFQLVLLKLSAEQKTVKLLWVAYLSCFRIGLGFNFSCILVESLFSICQKLMLSQVLLGFGYLF